MRPGIPGLISVHDLKILFSNSTEWVTLHTLPESVSEPAYKDAGPFVSMLITLVPGEPVQTEFEVDHETNLVKRVQIRRKAEDVIIRPKG